MQLEEVKTRLCVPFGSVQHRWTVEHLIFSVHAQGKKNIRKILKTIKGVINL